MSRRFAYALEPLLLLRTWRLDELRLELAGVNARLAEEEEHERRIEGEAQALREEWRELAGPKRVLRPETLAVYSAWQGRLERRCAEARARRDDLRAQGAALGLRVAEAMREVDAVERHKADTRAAFRAEQAKADLKDADDHWSILTTRREHVSQA